MNHTFIDELIQNCLTMLKQLDFKESVIKRHRRRLLNLKYYMKANGQNLYDETVGEKYQLDMLTEGNIKDYRLKEIRHSVNLLNDMLNHVPVRRKRIHLTTFPLSGEFGKHAQAFLEQFEVDSRPTGKTMRMYITALSHFTVRMQQDDICLENLDNVAISRFVASQQNTQVRICVPLRRFLRYLFEMHLTKTDLSIPLFYIKSHRAEKLPSLYNTEEIRKMDASIGKTGRKGKRDYAIFLLASRLGLRASDICLLQFRNLDWDRNVINLVQCKTKKEIELPLLAVIGEAIIDYVQNGRPKSDSKTIFLTANAPYTPISVPGLSSIVSGIIYKAGIETKDRRHGAHCLRHSLATQLLKQGTTLPVISETLGHRNSQTTMIYLGVDVNGLLHCSLYVPPVPESFYMQKGGWFYE
ncbi:MAG: site-specific integrase [Bacteroidota bacterium]|nr:site-specific integrase [Bacteroidota bacterium]